LLEISPGTRSLCPACFRIITARKIEENDKIYLEKTCPEHGGYKVLIWRQNARHYTDWAKGSVRGSGAVRNYSNITRGCPYDCGLCPEHRTRACATVIEVTDNCNLACPVCFANAERKQIKEPGIVVIREMYQSVLEGVGACTIQLSGGEPTLRDDLPEIAALGRELGFKHILINTNGIRIAQDLDYLRRIKSSGAGTIYLQFDGTNDGVYHSIRGQNLFDIKTRALANCALINIGVVLVPTVIPGINDQQLGNIIQFAKEWMPVVKGVHFQPVSYLGRYPHTPVDSDRITIPDIIAALETQTGGEIKVSDFLPRHVEESHCGFSGIFVLTEEGKLQALTGIVGEHEDKRKSSGEIPEESTRRFMAQHWQIDDCCCQTGDNISFIDRILLYNLTISGMPFQDVWNLDLERLHSCCIHVVTQDKRIIPFCAYYLTDANGRRLYSDTPVEKVIP
jgi:7,8-dihydro-6-hydroxymethylpterin dimethyltransferase